MILDADHVRGNIWQGAAPPEHLWNRLHEHFDVLVLTAAEFQPKAQNFPGLAVVHVPLHDKFFKSHAEIKKLGKDVAHVVKVLVPEARRGKRILVTCAMGFNRSGLVTAGLLHALYGMAGHEVVRIIRRARGPRALTNPQFNVFVESLPPGVS